MTKKLTAARTINAPKAAVWEVLADFGNVANWTSQVQTSYTTSDESTGLGATRHCDLAPLGQLEESIVDFIPEQRLGISIDSAKRLPIKSAISAFELREIDAETTEVTMTTDPKLKGGPIAPLLRKLAGGRLNKSQDALLADLAVAAEAHEVSRQLDQ